MQNIPSGNMVAGRTGWIALLTCATIVGNPAFARAILFPALASLATIGVAALVATAATTGAHSLARWRAGQQLLSARLSWGLQP